jgi:hypothetical protein
MYSSVFPSDDPAMTPYLCFIEETAVEVWTRTNLAGGLSCVSLINIGRDLMQSFNSGNIQHVVIFFNIF